MTSTSDADVDGDDTAAPPSPRWHSLAWWFASALTVMVVALERIAETRHYFFWDDSQLGSFGAWYELGRQIRSGEWTILDPGSWQGGNYLAEQQWGMWSPLSWLVGVSSHVLDNPAVFTTLVKIVFLLLLQTAAFGLARSYGASAPWSALAGASAAVGGQTLYMDAPSWVTGLQSVGLFVLTWWMLRRHLDHGRNPWAYFVTAYLLIASGYVFAVIALIFLFVALLVEAAWTARDRARVVRVLGLGAYSGLLTIFVYLPGVLTAPVTVRAGSGIANDQFLGMDLGDLATGASATGLSSVAGYWGPIAPVPIQYLGWFLPLLLVLVPAVRREWRHLVVPGVVGLLTLAMVLGPSVVGPLRYPARMLPYLVVCLAVAFAVLATRGWPRHATRRNVLVVVGATSLSLWLAWSAQPDNMRWLAIGGALQIVAVVAVLKVGSRVSRERAVPWAVAISLVATTILLGAQVQLARTAPLGDFKPPRSVEEIQSVTDDVDTGVFAVGDLYTLQADPGPWSEVLLANMWHVTDVDSPNVYTVLPLRTLVDRLCIDLRGVTCPDAYFELFTPQVGGTTMADDMHLNTVIVLRDDLDPPEVAPDGWTLDDSGTYTWTVRRDDPVAPAGGVTRTDGVEVSDVDVRDTEVTFTVDEVEGDAGEVVLSRIDWPGYGVDGAREVDATQGYLLTVEVSADQVGDEVTVTFRPPGWPVELASVVLAAVLGLVWSVTHRVRRREPASQAD
ncbi:hypothetical protein [Aeromicrobium sp. Sec7.5]|uniref:hypothetical protein n=1 Tax=Aeromicrobium sp. Sec7.5 TaxID=3121276 RepID=UPI002FE43CF9